MTDIYKKLYETLTRGDEAVLTTTLSAGGIEKSLTQENMTEAIADQKPGSLLFFKDDDRTVLVEQFSPRPRLIVFGGGHISLALAPMAAMMDFDLIIYDDRPSFSSPFRFPMADRTICDSFEAVPQNLTFMSTDYVVITTRGHRHDEDCLRHVLSGTEPFYTGMIGSKRRVAIIKKQLLEQKYDQEKLDHLCSPIGLNIGALTPPEIAISILAQIIQKRREGEQGKDLGKLESFADMQLLRFLAGHRDMDLALATVLTTKGSTPRRAGAKMAVFFDGRTLGSIGGGCSEAAVITQARSVIGTGNYLMTKVDLTDSAEEDGMVCGGYMEVLIEDLKASPQLS
ncbi:MAG: XdhC family protein [Deltaproteobacteria bacterium]|nr:XdhC family protein [Deltaproteobacteria bacterium]